MTTDAATLRAESRFLVGFGVARYEDGVVCGGIARYLSDVGAIPSGAWGTLPGVSDRLRRDWATALGNRISEAVTIRDELERIADGILQIAANYEGTDLVVATSFDLVNQDLRSYLPATDGYAATLRIRPGGVGVVPQPRYPKLGDERPPVVIPPENERLTATRHEMRPSIREVEGPIRLGSTDGNDLTISGGRTVYYENGEADRLNEFVQEHRDTLLQLEALLTQLGTGHRLPLSDLIVHAWRSSPGIVRNRADLIHSVGNTYAELRKAMDGELERLALYWEGSAATAFTQYGKTTSAYLKELEAQAHWLADEGRRAADALEGLRIAYATAGYERIGTLIAALSEYQTRVRGMFSCDNPEQALIDAVTIFVDYLVDAEGRQVEALAQLLKIEDQERRERPNLGTRGHDALPFPRLEAGAGAWSEDDAWKPRAERPSA